MQATTTITTLYKAIMSNLHDLLPTTNQCNDHFPTFRNGDSKKSKGIRCAEASSNNHPGKTVMGSVYPRYFSVNIVMMVRTHSYTVTAHYT